MAGCRRSFAICHKHSWHRRIKEPKRFDFEICLLFIRVSEMLTTEHSKSIRPILRTTNDTERKEAKILV